MARPTDYNAQIIQKAKDYLASCEDEEEQEIAGESKKGTEFYRTKLRVHLPTIEGLALYIGVARDTIYEWEGQEGKEQFSDIIASLRQMQADRLISKGLSGDYNSTIAKVLLSKHGYHDKQEVEHSGAMNVNVINFADTHGTV